jgi:regulator of sigma E protease
MATAMGDAATTVLSTIFVLGVLIFVHELGHFLVAKWVGIRVERFSLGFPPKMVGFTRGDTEYCISWLPLGGYVKMAGENPDDEEIKGEPDEFMSKSVGTRSLVILAGPLMNFVTAMLILIGVLWLHGRDYIDPNRVVVGPVVADGPADGIGIRPGDVINAVDHEPVSSFDEMATKIHSRPGDSLEIVWAHEGDVYSAKLKTMIDTLKTQAGTDTVVGMIGIGAGFSTERVGLGPAIVGGVEQTFNICGAIVKFLVDLVTLKISIKMVSGPVGIARIAGQVAQEGWSALLNFMALLSLNLAILNILPIPVLDGGHMVFLGAEKLRGRPLSIRARAIAQQIGLILLLLLIVTVTYNDILR